MKRLGEGPRFDVEQHQGLISVFPVGYDRSDLLEVTRLQDRYRKFFNVKTGETVDCEEFAKQMDAWIG